MTRQMSMFRIVVVICLLLTLCSAEAFAWGGHGGHYYRGGRWYRSGWFGLDVAVAAQILGAKLAVNYLIKQNKEITPQLVETAAKEYGTTQDSMHEQTYLRNNPETRSSIAAALLNAGLMTDNIATILATPDAVSTLRFFQLLREQGLYDGNTSIGRLVNNLMLIGNFWNGLQEVGEISHTMTKSDLVNILNSNIGSQAV